MDQVISTTSFCEHYELHQATVGHLWVDVSKVRIIRRQNRAAYHGDTRGEGPLS